MYKISIVFVLFSVQCIMAQDNSNQKLVRANATERVQLKPDSVAKSENKSLIMSNTQGNEDNSLKSANKINNLLLKRAISTERQPPLETRLRAVNIDTLRKAKE